MFTCKLGSLVKVTVSTADELEELLLAPELSVYQGRLFTGFL